MSCVGACYCTGKCRVTQKTWIDGHQVDPLRARPRVEPLQVGDTRVIPLTADDIRRIIREELERRDA